MARKADAEVAELRAEVETLRSAGMMTGAGDSPEDAEFDITEDEIDAMMAAGEPVELTGHQISAGPAEADPLREALRQAQFKTTPWQRED